jgi:hypothetical protein
VAKVLDAALERATLVAFLAGVVLLPVMRPVRLHVLGADVIPADALFVVAGAACLLGLIRRRERLWRAPFPAAAAAYLGAVVLATVTSQDPGRSVGRAVINTYVVGLGVLAFVVLGSEPVRRRFAAAWLTGTAITAVTVAVGLVLYYFAGLDTAGENLTLSERGSVPIFLPRADALFHNPNALCSYLVVSLALTWATWADGYLSRRLAALMAAVTAALLVLTVSPGLGGAALAVGLLLWLGRERGTAVAALAGVAVGAAFLVVTADRSTRPEAWRDAASAVAERPILGHGLGADLAHVPDRRGPAVPMDAHNTWLSVAGQMGLVGAAALLGVVATLVALVWRARPLAAHPFALAVWCAFVGAFLYHGLSMSAEEMRHVWILMGVLAAACSLPRPAARPAPAQVGGSSPVSP